jgi:uncharacterized protein YebE (UPF0316 family)
VALTARGRRIAGAVTAGVEAVVFAAAFSSLMANLDAIERVAGYALGVAAGTFVGMALDDRLSLGQSVVRVVTNRADPTRSGPSSG